MGNVIKLMAHTENNAQKVVKYVMLNLSDRLEVKAQVYSPLSIDNAFSLKSILSLHLKCLHSQTKRISHWWTKIGNKLEIESGKKVFNNLLELKGT